MSGKTIHIQDSKTGEMKGRVSLGGKTPPTPSEAPRSLSEAPQGQTVEYDQMHALMTAMNLPKRTGKVGTDVPPLVIEVEGKGRYYVAHPDDAPYARENLEKALEEGKAFPSFTTVIGSFDKPALLTWATRLTAEAAEDRLYALAEATEEERNDMLDKWLVADPLTGKTPFRKELSTAYEEKKEEAATRGTEVHAIVEAITHGENPDIPPYTQGYVDAYLALREEYPDMEFIYTEATVLNEEDGAMGTADAIVKFNGKYYVADFKTNKRGTVYPTTGMQLAASANGTAIVYEDGTKEPLPPISGGIGIGLSPRGKYGLFFFETEKNGPNHQGFKAAVSAWRWNHKHHEDSEVLTRESWLAK